MATAILMPQVGQDLTEGKLVEWKVKAGDSVEKGDIVAVVESEKASFEVEAFDEGVVLELLYKKGDLTKVLEPLLYIGQVGESLPSRGNGQDRSASPAKQPESSTPAAQSAGKKVGASPLARRLALKHGIDLAALAGSGPRGTIVKRDIDEAVAALGRKPAAHAAPAAGPRPMPSAPMPLLAEADREEPFSRMRQVIAERLSLSKRTIPHFYLRAEADVTDLLARRRAHIETGGTKVSINDVLIQAAALTLREFPRLNAHVASDRLVLKAQVNVGVAVSVEEGLMVPVIADADRKSLVEINALIRDYAAAARRGVSKSTAPGTFSISNLGMYGVEVFPIINPPEAGILGVGPVQRQVREHRGGIHLRDVLSLMLSADHRAVDGVYGAQFLTRLVETIEGAGFED